MKKILALLLLIAGTLTFAFADDFSDSADEYDDFDDIFLDATEDVVVEESAPVVPAASSSSSGSLLNLTGHFDGSVGVSAIIERKSDFGGYLNEYYKKGDTYNIWSELVAVHHFPNAYSPIDRIKDFKDYFGSMNVPSSLTFDMTKSVSTPSSKA